MRFCKHSLLSAVSIPPAIVFGCLLRNVLSALLPPLAAIALCGGILVIAQGLLLAVIGLAQPRWVRVLVRR